MLRTTYFNVSQDSEIPIPGFMIVGANRHVTSILEMGDEEKRELTSMRELA